MDHCGYPSNTEVEHLCVRFLCDGEAVYDGGPFSSYHLRKGWSDNSGTIVGALNGFAARTKNLLYAFNFGCFLASYRTSVAI